MHNRQHENVISHWSIDNPVGKRLDEEAPDVASNAAPGKGTSLDLPEAGLKRFHES